MFKDQQNQELGIAQSGDYERELDQQAVVSQVAQVQPQDQNTQNIKIDEDFECGTKEEIKLYQKAIKLDKLIQYIRYGDAVKDKVKDQDIVLLIGKTGTGKSTTVHFLQKIKIIQKEVETQEMIDGVSYTCSQKILIAEHALPGFDIGHKPESETSFINAIETVHGVKLCDAPGFEDNREVEIDIANSIGITSALKGCKSVRPILLLSYHELMDARGAVRTTLNIVTGLVKCFKDIKQNFQIVFTKVPIDINEQNISAEIRNLLKAKDIQENEEIKDFVTYIFIECVQSRIQILRPQQDDPDDLWNCIMNRAKIENPSEQFEYALSFKSKSKLDKLCDDIKFFVIQYTENMSMKQFRVALVNFNF